MKKILPVTVCFIGAFLLTGCAWIKPKAKVENIVIQELPPYLGPKARIAVADFELKTAKASIGVSEDLHKILVSALNNSSRFALTDRLSQDALPQQNPDLIISAAVTEFEPEASGGRAGIGGGGGINSGIFGGLLGVPADKARIALEVKVTDALKAQVLVSRLIQGQASDIEKATGICISETVRYLCEAIAKDYYKY